MIYLILDSAGQKGFDKYRELSEKFSKNREIFRFNSVDFSSVEFEALLESQPLFGRPIAVFCNGLSDNPEAGAILEKSVSKIAQSPNCFVLLEKELPSALGKKIKKLSQEVWHFEEPARPKNKWADPRWNPFQLTDALAQRDRRKLWVLMQQAILAGVKPEEIFWKVFWQVKNLLVAKRTKNVKDSGLSPYPYQKAKTWATRFSDQELENLSASLVSLYHDSRRGLADFGTSLELFILSV